MHRHSPISAISADGADVTATAAAFKAPDGVSAMVFGFPGINGHSLDIPWIRRLSGFTGFVQDLRPARAHSIQGQLLLKARLPFDTIYVNIVYVYPCQWGIEDVLCLCRSFISGRYGLRCGQ